MKYNDIITDGVDSRRILGVVDEIAFVSDVDFSQVAFYDTINNLLTNYTVVAPAVSMPAGAGSTETDPYEQNLS